MAVLRQYTPVMNIYIHLSMTGFVICLALMSILLAIANYVAWLAIQLIKIFTTGIH